VDNRAASKFGSTVADSHMTAALAARMDVRAQAWTVKTVLADVELGPGPLSAFRRSAAVRAARCACFLLAQRAMVLRVRVLF
jgi:hypothetical protein